MIIDLDVLQNWLNEYTMAQLHNEDDVETKFVLPLFQMLGYPETHRRGKYPVTIHTGRKGRKHEVDQAYFASADKEQQAAGQSLVIVEAKQLNENDFDEATAQAQSYGEQLRPLMIVVTNGHRIIVFRRRRFGSDERVIDSLIKELAAVDGVQRLISLLRFDLVFAQHEQLNDLAHERFIHVEQMLRSYPDIQGLLAQGDFIKTEEHIGLQLRVARSKIQIEGSRPVCLGGGSCEITFSHLLRRGLRLNLTHKDIMTMLMVGIGSHPTWDTRHFIEREAEETYLVRLGNLETRLSAQEAQDLCDCVDYFAGAYRDTIMQTEDILESWSFPMATYEGHPAFYLTSIHPSFWQQVGQFTNDYDRFLEKQDAEWSRFEFWTPGFRIGYDRGDYAQIATINELSFDTPIGIELKHLVYVLLDGRPLPSMDSSDVLNTEWQHHVGVNDQWTVQQTHQWITGKLLPEVERRCRANPEEFRGRVKLGQLNRSPNKIPYLQRDAISSSFQFVPYLTDIQRWLTRYTARMIQTRLMVKPYKRLLNIARNADPAKLDIHYITNNLPSVTTETDHPEAITPDEHMRDFYRRAELLSGYLDRVPTISPYSLDRTMRSFFALYDDAPIAASQFELNQTWQALKPLWRLAQFEQRHVWPYMEERK